MTDSDLVVRLAEMAAEIRGLIGEAHGVLKDLRKVTADARSAAKTAVDEEVAAEVARQMEALGSVTREAMDRAVTKVEAEFDELADIVMGRSDGKIPLRTLVMQTRGQAPLRCPECGAEPRGHVAYEGEPGVVVLPGEGDWSVCRHCGMVSRFTATGELRKITTTELQVAMKQPSVVRAVTEMQDHVGRRG